MRWSTKAQSDSQTSISTSGDGADARTTGGPMRPGLRLATGAVALVSVAFPLAILFAADSIGSWPFIALLAAAMVLRLYLGMAGRGISRMLIGQACAVAAIVGLGFVDDVAAALLYPVAVSAAMLCVFGFSLLGRATMVETLARLTDPNLPASAVAYCRTVTKVWCAFFALNGAIALFTAFWTSREVWAIYNGVVSYMLIGCLLAAEYLVRLRIRRKENAA